MGFFSRMFETKLDDPISKITQVTVNDQHMIVNVGVDLVAGSKQWQPQAESIVKELLKTASADSEGLKCFATYNPKGNKAHISFAGSDREAFQAVAKKIKQLGNNKLTERQKELINLYAQFKKATYVEGSTGAAPIVTFLVPFDPNIKKDETGMAELQSAISSLMKGRIPGATTALDEALQEFKGQPVLRINVPVEKAAGNEAELQEKIAGMLGYGGSKSVN